MRKCQCVWALFAFICWAVDQFGIKLIVQLQGLSNSRPSLPCFEHDIVPSYESTCCISCCLDIRFRKIIAQYLSHLERSEEHTSELQSLMRISYAVFCLKNKKT